MSWRKGVRKKINIAKSVRKEIADNRAISERNKKSYEEARAINGPGTWLPNTPNS